MGRGTRFGRPGPPVMEAATESSEETTPAVFDPDLAVGSGNVEEQPPPAWPRTPDQADQDVLVTDELGGAELVCS